ncbi:MAG: helix-turn-helix domain-containing protein [Pirellulaceae bacterium]|nr:helix-turn-helix domain-containing protein [Pirellulaceae bacterium]
MTHSRIAPKRLLVDVRAAARMLSISPRKIWSITASGELPCVRIGRAVRYAVADLEAWIDQQRKRGGTR